MEIKKLTEGITQTPMDSTTKEVYEFLLDKGYDDTEALQNYADAVAEYVDMMREGIGEYSLEDWYKETLENYPEELEGLEVYDTPEDDLDPYILDGLNELDMQAFDEGLEYHDLKGLYESTDLTYEEKRKISDALRDGDDPDMIASYLKDKLEKDDLKEDIEIIEEEPIEMEDDLGFLDDYVPDVLTDSEISNTDMPEQGEDIGLADLILGAMKTSIDKIQEYNAISANLGDHEEELEDTLEDVAATENETLGKLESMLEVVSPNADNISDGAEEAEEMSDLTEGIDNYKEPLTTVITPTEANAIEDDKEVREETDEIIDPLKRAKAKPFIGAEKQEMPKEPELPEVLKESLDEEEFSDFNSDFYNAIVEVLYNYRGTPISREDVENAYSFFDAHFYESDDNEDEFVAECMKIEPQKRLTEAYDEDDYLDDFEDRVAKAAAELVEDKGIPLKKVIERLNKIPGAIQGGIASSNADFSKKIKEVMLNNFKGRVQDSKELDDFCKRAANNIDELDDLEGYLKAISDFMPDELEAIGLGTPQKKKTDWK